MNARATPDQFGLFDDLSARATYPARPGSKERGGASEDAARIMAPSAAALREAVLAQFVEVGEQGLTADECATKLKRDELSIRPRCSELVASRQIIKTLERRPTRRGMTASVMRIAPGPIPAFPSSELRAAQEFEAAERARTSSLSPTSKAQDDHKTHGSDSTL